MTWRVFTDPGYVIGSGIRPGEPIPILQMDLISNLILQRGVGVATFTRSTTGTFEAVSTGLVTTAAIDEARFEANGVLIEGESTNLLLRSEEFDNVDWTKFQSSVVSNTTTSPDGTNTADTVTSTLASPGQLLQNHLTSAINTTFSAFFYIKQGTGSIGELQFNTRNLGASIKRGRVQIDASDGSITLLADDSLNLVFSSVTLTNGWFQFKLTATTTADTLDLVRVQLNLPSDNKSFFIWGAQLEELPFASSYIKTIATSVTRASDNLSIDAANIPVPTANYSVSADVDILGDVLGASEEQPVMWVEGESFRFLRATASNSNKSDFRSGNVTLLDPSISIVNTTFKMVGTVNTGGDLILYKDGSQVDSKAYGADPTGNKTAVLIGRRASSTERLFGHIKSFRIYDKALTPDEVANL